MDEFLLDLISNHVLVYFSMNIVITENSFQVTVIFVVTSKETLDSVLSVGLTA